MASSRRLPPHSNILETLQYFDKYDFPLTKEEIIYWSDSSDKEINFNNLANQTHNFYHLPGRKQIVEIRKNRGETSQQKWTIAVAIGEKLKAFPTIQAVFVTGSLAMNNAKSDDDIDVMIITSANTLWITRFFVNVYFQSQRRHPNQLTITNKLCPNLWLDVNHLTIQKQNLYTAHEIMQAKVLWDRSHIHAKFIIANFWVKRFLPNAFPDQLKVYPINYYADLLVSLLIPVNLVFFTLQYLYMKPKMTTERVAPGYAFFHPKKS